MKKPSKEVLDQYIYDYSVDEAIEKFNLTENQLETILYGAKPKRKVFEYSEDTELVFSFLIDIEDEKVKIIYNSIKENYYLLRKYFIKNGDIEKLNVNAENPEDKFHNALIKVIENLERFEFRSDEKTLEYIKSRLFFQEKTDRKKDKISKVRSVEIIRELTSNNIEVC